MQSLETNLSKLFLCAPVQKYMEGKPTNVGVTCFPISRGFLPVWLRVLRSRPQNSMSLLLRGCIHAEGSRGVFSVGWKSFAGATCMGLRGLMALQPYPEEEQAGVRDPRGSLDPAAHPQADAEVCDAQRLEITGHPQRLGRTIPAPDPPASFLSSHQICRNGTKKALLRPRREAPCCRTPWRPSTPSLSLSRSKESTVMSSSWESSGTTPLP